MPEEIHLTRTPWTTRSRSPRAPPLPGCGAAGLGHKQEHPTGSKPGSFAISPSPAGLIGENPRLFRPQRVSFSCCGRCG